MSTNQKPRAKGKAASSTAARATARRAPKAAAMPASDRVNETVYAAVVANAGGTTSAVAEMAGLNRQAVAKALAALEAAGRVVRVLGAGTGRNAAPTWLAVKVNPSGTVKLSKGQLADQAMTFLRERPGLEFTPGEIGRKLGGRSSGAVLNALMKLVPGGDVVQTSERPVRFTIATAKSNGTRVPTRRSTAKHA